MRNHRRSGIHLCCVPLAAALAAALAVPQAGAVHAAATRGTTVPVTSCLDDGSPGTLRSVVAAAVSGDVVDMSQLACGTITLASGEIAIGVADLTLQGPGANLLAIDGAYAGRVLDHSVAGTLTINDLSLVHGHYETGSSLGGCLYSIGETDIHRSIVTSCSTAGGTFFAGGGGLAVYGNLNLDSSTLTGNAVARPGSGTYLSLGGAALVVGTATIVNSTISGNTVQGTPGAYGYHAYGGGISVAGTLAISNSTIAFNTAGRGGGGVFGLGYDIELYSSIVADNAASYAGYFAADIGGYGTLSGSNDLIVASDLTVPPDTLNDDPQLITLADNGGPTPTHAVSSTSPAIDTGDNAMSLPFDQRGDGYPRVSGIAADIGAFEYQQTFAVPTVAKSFAPGTVNVASPSTLTITLTNTNAVAATLIADLVDDLPDPIVVASPSDAATTCAGGSVVADSAGTSVTLLSGAAIPPGGDCTVTVSVVSDATGTFVNTIPAGALQTDQGDSPSAATASITVAAQTPMVGKAFAPDSIAAGDATTLTITLTNGNAVPATLSTDLDDVLPPSLTVAAGPPAMTTCAGGAVSADPGAGTVALAAGAEIPANGTCTVTAGVTAALPGVFTNTIPAGALATSLGANAEAASATLTVTTADRIFADGFEAAPRANTNTEFPRNAR